MRRPTESGVENKMPATLKDIAKETGKSLSSVSAVLAGNADKLGIKKATRELICRTAGEMNYHRNDLARQMVTGKSKQLCYYCYDMGGNEYSGKIVSGIIQEADKHGYSLRLLGDSEDGIETTIDRIIGSRVAGIIVRERQVDERLEKAAKEYKIPIVYTGGPKEPLPGTVVNFDIKEAVRQLLAHLSQNGHTKIGLLSSCSIDKNAFYDEILNTAPLLGFKRVNKLYNLLAPENKSELLEVLTTGELTAFPCWNDIEAMRLYSFAAEHGFKIPEDFSVTGLDDLNLAKIIYPPLTTVRLQMVDLGIAAAKEIITRIETRRTYAMSPQIKPLPVELVERESVASLNS